MKQYSLNRKVFEILESDVDDLEPRFQYIINMSGNHIILTEDELIALGATLIDSEEHPTRECNCVCHQFPKDYLVLQYPEHICKCNDIKQSNEIEIPEITEKGYLIPMKPEELRMWMHVVTNKLNGR